MGNQKFTYTVSGIVILLISLLLLVNYSLGPLVGYIADQYNIRLQGLETHILSGQIHVQSLSYDNDDISVEAEDVFLRPNLSGIKAIKARQVTATIKSLNWQNGDSTSIQMPQFIEIEHLHITASSILKHVELNDFHAEIKPFTSHTTFKYHNDPYGVKTSTYEQGDDFIYTLNMYSAEDFIELAAIDTKDKLTIQSNNQSSIKNFYLIHDKGTKQWEGSIKHNFKSNNINIYASLNLQSDELFINIKSLNLNSKYLQVSAKGVIDTSENIYDINGTVNNSSLSIWKKEDIHAQLYLDDLAELSPYIHGDCEIDATFTKDAWRVNATSNKITLPLMRIENATLSYDSSRSRFVTFSAMQMRNSLLSIDSPSFTIDNINDSTLLTFTGESQSLPQQISMNLTHSQNILEMTVPDFLIQNTKQKWSLNQKSPSIITPEKFDSGDIHLSSNTHSYADVKIQYFFESGKWSVYNKLSNINLNFQTNELLDSETDIILEASRLDGEGTITGSPHTDNTLQGEFTLSQIDGKALNIIPNFIIPLDYYMHNSKITWNSSGLSGQLHAKQGDINFYTRNNVLYAQSQTLEFSHGENNASLSFDLSLDENLIAGQVHIFSLRNNPDHTDSYVSLPNDIDIIGDISVPSAPTSSTDVNLEIHAKDAPISIYGFEGKLDGDINMLIPKNAPPKITGKLELHEPSLTLLNKSIAFTHMYIDYDQDDWMDGQLDILLKDQGVFHSTHSSVTGEINLTISGQMNNPIFDISSSPMQLTQIESLSHIFSSSKQLPPGNENYTMLEIISGLKRNAGVIFVLETLNNFANLIHFDITIRPGYDDSQGFTDNIKQTEIVFTKKLHDKVFLTLRHQFDREQDSASLNVIITPDISAEMQYSKKDIAATIFYHN